MDLTPEILIQFVMINEKMMVMKEFYDSYLDS
jgi:hypothetical protein